MKRYLILTALGGIILISSALENELPDIGQQNLADVLFELGDEKPEHYLEDYSLEDVKRGYELIHFGRTKTEKGKFSKYISKFYKCISCHNVVREDLDLSKVDQNERLNYAIENDLPYLQGSTFWGIVNRESWYNDDYIIKYGNLVEKAKNSLIESTQLCAQVCSQGRELEEWELNSILAYYWSLQLKISDLDLNKTELQKLKNLSDESLIDMLKAKYLQKSPASFAYPPEDKSKGYDKKGNFELGKEIYRRSCQHCHRFNGESDVVLDEGKSTLRWLKKNITKKSKLSIYEIIRYGTYSELGHKEYMPLYTQEKMSNLQIEHLRAFIEGASK